LGFSFDPLVVWSPFPICYWLLTLLTEVWADTFWDTCLVKCMNSYVWKSLPLTEWLPGHLKARTFLPFIFLCSFFWKSHIHKRPRVPGRQKQKPQAWQQGTPISSYPINGFKCQQNITGKK
jgi:hypothetical protein